MGLLVLTLELTESTLSQYTGGGGGGTYWYISFTEDCIAKKCHAQHRQKITYQSRVLVGLVGGGDSPITGHAHTLWL